jgi:hypothetical protein
MAKESVAVGGQKVLEAANDGGRQSVKGSGGFAAQVAVWFGEGHLDGIEAGAEGRQVEDGGAASGDKPGTVGSLVDAAIVHDDLVAGT